MLALGGLTALAPTASAGTTSVDSTCDTPLGPRTGPQQIRVDFLETRSIGGVQTKAYVDLGTTPLAAPPPGLPAGSTVSVDLTLAYAVPGWGATGTLVLTGEETPLADTPGRLDPPPAIATFTVPRVDTAQPYVFVPVAATVKLHVPGSDFAPIPCSFSGGGVVEFLTVDNMPLIVEIGISPRVVDGGETLRAGGAGTRDTLEGFELCTGGSCTPITPDSVTYGSMTYEAFFTVGPHMTPGAHTIEARLAWGYRARSQRFLVEPSAATTPPRPITSTVDGEVNPGTLVMSQSGTGVRLSPVVLNGKPQQMSGALNQISVKDFRGTTLGWDLTGQLTDFVSPEHGGAVPSGAASWTPSCAITNPESPSRVAAGSSGALGLLCRQGANPAGAVSGGEFTGDAALRVAVPAWQLSGTYTAQLTLTLI